MIKHLDGTITHVNLVLSIETNESTAMDSWSSQTFAVVYNVETQDTSTVELKWECQGQSGTKASAEIDALQVYRDILETKRLTRIAEHEAKIICKGKKVKVLKGKNKDIIGTVFWSGPDKFVRGATNFGLKTNDGQTIFVNEYYLEVWTPKLVQVIK